MQRFLDGWHSPRLNKHMEIVTYVRSGAISHEDSLGNKGRTAAGDVQVAMEGVAVQRLGRSGGANAAIDTNRWLYRVRWQPSELASVSGGATNPANAAEGTVRKLFATDIERNAILKSPGRGLGGQSLRWENVDANDEYGEP